MAHSEARTGGAKHSDTSDADTGQSDKWRTRPYLALFVDNIPSHWMVAELKALLDGFGHVVKIEIFENREALHLFSIPI